MAATVKNCNGARHASAFRPGNFPDESLALQQQVSAAWSGHGRGHGGALVLVFVNLSRDIQTANNELGGLQMLKPVNKMAQFMQQHRGLSSGVLNGNDAMKDKRAAKEKEVSDVVMTSEAALSPKLRDSATWKKFVRTGKIFVPKG